MTSTGGMYQVHQSDFKQHRYLRDSVRKSAGSNEVTLAIFGIGRIGGTHFRNLVMNPDVNLAYVVEPDQERREMIKEKWRLDKTVFLDITEADQVWNDSKVQAVVIATPTQSHEALVLRAMAVGKSVLCEKPVAPAYETVKDCYEQAARKHKLLLCAFNRRFDPTFKLMRSKAKSGEIGKILSVRTCSRDCPLPSMHYLRTSGGIFKDCAVHDIDMICWVLGERPVSVFVNAQVHNQEIADMNDVDVVVILLKFPSGVLGTIELSRLSVYGYDQRLEIFGSHGMIESGMERPVAIQTHTYTEASKVPPCHSFQSRYSEAYSMELEHFVRALQGKEQIEVTSEDALAVLKVTEACQKSLVTGNSVSLKWD